MTETEVLVERVRRNAARAAAAPPRRTVQRGCTCPECRRLLASTPPPVLAPVPDDDWTRTRRDLA